jgi:predicted PurR-regulated permease PerM
MKLNRIVEYSFFFILLALSGYMVWLIAQPFMSALALAAIIVTICQPLHNWISQFFPTRKSLNAFVTTILALVLVVLPVVTVSSLVANEVISVYQDLRSGSEITLGDTVSRVEGVIQGIIPDFELNINQQLEQVAQWFTGNITQIFAGTISTIFIFIISLIGAFYFFRDGREFLQMLIKVSPLPDEEDAVIFQRMSQAVRSVATGSLLVALVQGFLVAVGFLIAGIPNVILFGSLTAVMAIIPGVGTGFVTTPAIFILLYNGEIIAGIFLAIWAAFIVGTVDNILGPYLMSRGNNMHPFIILISVLGGISLFGPIGFIVGPVIMSLFMVLLEIYNQYIIQEQLPSQTNTDQPIARARDYE